MSDIHDPHDPALTAQLMACHDDSPLLTALFDEHDVLRYANPAFQAAYDVEPDGQLNWAAIMRHNHVTRRGAMIETQDIEAWIASVLSRRGKTAFRAFEADLSDGRWIWMTETLQKQGWLLCVASDITALRQDSRALRQAHARALAAAQTDVLTALGNRRHGLLMLDQALLDVDHWPLCVALIDLDDFKQINDQLGHAAGDAALIHFARQLQATSRREDGCSRLGGDEFLLILPTAGQPQAEAIIQRLIERVNQARPLPEHPQMGYSCSVGLAQAQWGESSEVLLSRADAALYRAKQAGRNRYAVAD
ncbi:GGDEF domain-containing protein [Roseateles koreensis]|uniref:diguanylate cyclase n=1 Tax=Roseateles koreensis TaxID=2987526 RepID=A0ABT5KPQ7_9BURK|nr:GGDEF domain-containing protein [Roseateles koreensis]MDC8784905.1 GGDEF domain-containing protein [Roseateles koreensis]